MARARSETSIAHSVLATCFGLDDLFGMDERLRLLNSFDHFLTLSVPLRAFWSSLLGSQIFIRSFWIHDFAVSQVSLNRLRSVILILRLIGKDLGLAVSTRLRLIN